MALERKQGRIVVAFTLGGHLLFRMLGTTPSEMVFVDKLPKTRSGKIRRRLLRARELGLPENDTSTKTKPGKVKHALEIEIEWREGEGQEGVALA